VEFSSVTDAQKAFKKYNNKELDGRNIIIDFAADRSSSGGGRGGGFAGGSRGRGGSGGRGRGGGGRGRGGGI